MWLLSGDCVCLFVCLLASMVGCLFACLFVFLVALLVVWLLRCLCVASACLRLYVFLSLLVCFVFVFSALLFVFMLQWVAPGRVLSQAYKHTNTSTQANNTSASTSTQASTHTSTNNLLSIGRSPGSGNTFCSFDLFLPTQKNSSSMLVLFVK